MSRSAIGREYLPARRFLRVEGGGYSPPCFCNGLPFAHLVSLFYFYWGVSKNRVSDPAAGAVGAAKPGTFDRFRPVRAI